MFDVESKFVFFFTFTFSRFIQDDDDFENWRSPWEHGVLTVREKNIHQQQDETVLGLAVFGKTDRRWAAAWINHLLESNSSIKDMRVLIRLREENRELTATPSPEVKKSGDFDREGNKHSTEQKKYFCVKKIFFEYFDKISFL